MAEKRYVVLEDQKYTGKHRVYSAGQAFPESELFGNEDNVKMALLGQKDVTKKDKEGKEYLAIKGKSPKIKLKSSKAAKK